MRERAEAHTPLGPADLFDLQYLRGARLSPDGKWIAYALSRTDDDERFELWVSDRTGKEPRRVPHFGNATAPSWSPDGTRIAFAGSERLRVATFPALNVSESLTPAPWAVRGTPAWSPDGTRLAVSLWRRQPVEGPRRIIGTHFRADGIGFLEGVEQGIYAIDLAGVDPKNDASRPTPQCLTPGLGMCSDPQWSPCGRRLLCLATEAAIPFASYSPRLLCVDVDTGAVTEILGERWYIICARWLPTGDRIAVAAARDSTLTIPTVALWVVDVTGDHAELRTRGAVGNVGCRLHHDMPAWDLTQDNTLTILDAATAFATVQKGGSAEVWKIALDGPIAIEPVLSGERSCVVLDACRASDTLLFAVTSLRSPTELWSSNLRGRAQRQITALNDEVLARWPRVAVKHCMFPSADGMQIEAWFLGPEGRQGALPTILFVHGGPFGATGQAFRYDFLLLASQGFGVLFANFRGSAGYGEDFARAIMGDWGGRGYPDHLGAVDAAIARGWADPERLGVWGPSHGGFATCWIVGHSRRFKAAVAEAAFTNFSTLYYLTDAPDGFRRDLGGRPDEIPHIYSARSPLTYAHRCTTPTLLLHGEDDLRCPIAEAEQFYRVLRDVGCMTELYRIPGCAHLGDSNGPLGARLAQNEALMGWFLRHL